MNLASRSEMIPLGMTQSALCKCSRWIHGAGSGIVDNEERDSERGMGGRKGRFAQPHRWVTRCDAAERRGKRQTRVIVVQI